MGDGPPGARRCGLRRRRVGGRAAQEVLPTTGGIGAARGEHRGRDRRSRSV